MSPIITVPILSILAWGLIIALAVYAPQVALLIGAAGLLAFIHDVVVEE